MENNTVKVIFEQIEICEKLGNLQQAINLGHDAEAILFKMPESKRLLQCYLKLFHLYYVNGDLSKAFNYFSLSEPLLLQFGEWNQYTTFMQSVVKTTFFYVRKTEIEAFVEQLMPLAFEHEQYEVLSHCFLTQSYIHLSEGAVELAIQEAKMAYFYAQFVEEEKQHFVLCNAQLQLVLALIEQIAVDKAQYYIDQFGWKIDGCKNDGEKVLVILVQSMVNLLNHKIEETIPVIQGVLQQLISSHEIMYSTILTRQLKLVISKVQGELTAQQYETLNDLCDQIMARFKMSQATFMNDYTTFSNSLIDTMEFTQSLNIFQVGQEHFDIALTTKQYLFCKIINVNYEELNAKEKELFKIDLIEANLLDANAQLIISQFSRELLIVMAIIPPSQKRLPIEKIISSEATYLVYDPTTNVFSNFHELFNYVFFNQLLEIDIDPFKKSLA